MEGRPPSTRGGAHPGDLRGEEGEGAGLDEAPGQPEDEDQRGGDSGQQLQETPGAGQEGQSDLQSFLPQELSSTLQHIKKETVAVIGGIRSLQDTNFITHQPSPL